MFCEYLLMERLDHWAKRADVRQRVLDRLKKFAATDSAARRVPLSEYGKAQMTDWSYVLGDVMFATLYDLVGQDEFNRIVGGYYRRFASGGTTRDFIDLATHTSIRNLTPFFDDWLMTTRWTSLVADARTPADLVEHYRKTGSARLVRRTP